MIPTIEPTIKQHLAYTKLEDNSTRYLVFGGGAGGGKSWLGCEWLLTMCYRYPGTKYFMGREELKRLMQSTFVTWLKVCKFHNIPKDDWTLKGDYNYIQFTNGSRIDLLDLKFLPTDPMYERLGSMEYTSGWIDEAGEIHFMAFDILKTRVGRHMNKDYNLIPKILLTCNPNKEWLYHTIYLPNKEGKLPREYFFIQSLYFDNPHTSSEYGIQLQQISDKAQRERLMAGNWEYDNDPAALMSYEHIIDLFTNTAEPDTERYITADIARTGVDKTVVFVWEGLEVIEIKHWSKQSLEQTRNELVRLSQIHSIPYSHIIVDEDGIGGGIVDFMTGIKGFMANRTPFDNPNTDKPDNYQNLKTQCYYTLADYVNTHKIGIRIDDYDIKHQLIEELQQVKAKDLDKDGKLKILPKDEVKLKLGRSPDFSDAMMMRMYFEVNHDNRPCKVNIFVPTFNKR
jgi:phage terminase large subunit